MFDVYKLITLIERAILVLIALFTVWGVGQEMTKLASSGTVALTDLLLMFIYAEVLGMVAAFYKSRSIPISIPIFIAITALCRLIILQGKGVSTIDLMYESGAVLLLALAALVIRWNFSRPNNGEPDEGRF
ncbi:MAG: phosphate-starvation-inducible PsiE family protein [Burkholderiaceae bacterium]